MKTRKTITDKIVCIHAGLDWEYFANLEKKHSVVSLYLLCDVEIFVLGWWRVGRLPVISVRAVLVTVAVISLFLGVPVAMSTGSELTLVALAVRRRRSFVALRATRPVACATALAAVTVSIIVTIAAIILARRVVASAAARRR